MPGPRPTKTLGWMPGISDARVTEPAAGLKSDGWQPGQRPTRNNLNWFFQYVEEWILWLEDVADEFLALTDPGSASLVAANSPYQLTDAQSGITLFVDTSAGPITIVTPLTPTANFYFFVKDIGGNVGTNPITIDAANGEQIEGLAADYLLESPYGSWKFYYDGTKYWAL